MLAEKPINNAQILAAKFIEQGYLHLDTGYTSKGFSDERIRLETLLENYKQVLEKRGIRQGEKFTFFELASRGRGRYDVSLGQEKALAFQAVLDFVHPILEAILGTEYCLLYRGAILAEPNCERQKMHRDGQILFEQLPFPLPPHALTLFVPLQDCSIELGPTVVLPGSHLVSGEAREDSARVALECRMGQAYMIDFRTKHYGEKNSSKNLRAINYWTYSKPWFVDHINQARENLL